MTEVGPLGVQVQGISNREEELAALLEEIAPGLRDILWCALCWNDHNFGYDDLLNKATRAATSMGINRTNGVDAVNHWMQRVDKALGHQQ